MRLAVLGWIFLCGLVVGGQTVKDAGFGKPHPEAPAELAQMAWIIGEWSVAAWFLQEDGSKTESTASMRARYVLDGFGIEIQNRYPRPGQPDFVGVHTFVFNPRLKKWIGAGINTLGNRKDFEARFEKDDMIVVQTGMQFGGQPGINRSRYFGIGEKGFKNRYDYSPDGGKTWREGTFGFTATRVR